MKTSLGQEILRGPYRVFFPLAVISGMIGVGYWFLFGIGAVKTYSGAMHAAIQMRVCMGCFIVGFLYTALPRMTATSFAQKTEFSSQLILTFGVLFFHLAGRLFWANITYALWLLSLSHFFLTRFKMRGSRQAAVFTAPPVEFVWVPAGICFALVGVLLSLLSSNHINLGQMGWALMNQGFVLCVVIGVGSFMGARITGRFRVTRKSFAASGHVEADKKAYRLALLFQFTGVFFLFFSFVLEGLGHVLLAYRIRAALITMFFFFSGVLPKWPKTTGLYVWILWLSFWLFTLGYWGVASHLKYRIESLHVSFLGGLGLMTYAVATMVVITHGGKPEQLRRPLVIFWIILIGVLISLVIRLLAVFYPAHYFQGLGLSSVFWVFVGLSWLIFSAPYLVRVVDPRIAHEHHERMKKTAS